jgi:DNA polymerase-1
MLLALDSDILMYKAASAAETEIDFGNDVWSLHTDLKEAKAAFEMQITKITDRLGVKEYVCCLSDHSNNFRKVVDPTYKSNRKGTRKPVGYVALCDWVEATFKTFRKDRLEADDCLGLIATKPGNEGKVIMVSDDMDLKTIPGKLYRPMADELLTITEADADKYFFTQVLTGDQVDGYKGIPGIGPKKAEAILGARPHWGAVEQAYIKAGMTRDDAIQQARLARILRWSDWHEEIEEIRLWTPQASVSH